MVSFHYFLLHRLHIPIRCFSKQWDTFLVQPPESTWLVLDMCLCCYHGLKFICTDNEELGSNVLIGGYFRRQRKKILRCLTLYAVGCELVWNVRFTVSYILYLSQQLVFGILSLFLSSFHSYERRKISLGTKFICEFTLSNVTLKVREWNLNEIAGKSLVSPMWREKTQL